MTNKTPSTTPPRSGRAREPAERMVRKGLPRADPAPVLGVSQHDRNLFDGWYHQLAIEPCPNTLEDDQDDEWLLASMRRLRSATPEELLELREQRLHQLARGEGSWSDLIFATVDHGPPATSSPELDIPKTPPRRGRCS